MWYLLLLITQIWCYETSIINNHIVKNVMFFPLQISNSELLPLNLYQSMTETISYDENINFIQSSGNYIKDVQYLNNLQNKSVSLMCHSTGFNNMMKVYNNIDSIDKLLLIDPIFLKSEVDKYVITDDIDDYVNSFIQSNKFDLVKNLFFKDRLDKNNFEFSKSEQLIYLFSKKSNNWKVLPPIPPIKRLFVDFKLLKNKNKKYIEIENFGHFDLLDSKWSDMIHNSLCKGCSNRDDVYKYYEYVRDYIQEL
jgi:hypothetical protein